MANAVHVHLQDKDIISYTEDCKRLFGRPRHNVQLVLTKVLESVDWINLADDTDRPTPGDINLVATKDELIFQTSFN